MSGSLSSLERMSPGSANRRQAPGQVNLISSSAYPIAMAPNGSQSTGRPSLPDQWLSAQRSSSRSSELPVPAHGDQRLWPVAPDGDREHGAFRRRCGRHRVAVCLGRHRYRYDDFGCHRGFAACHPAFYRGAAGKPSRETVTATCLSSDLAAARGWPVSAADPAGRCDVAGGGRGGLAPQPRR